MSAQHTQGRASLDTKGVGIDLPNHIPIDIGQHAAAAQVVWKMEDYERSPHCEETARRLVACWNACEGVETEVLESYPAPFISELRAQRDELRSENERLRGDCVEWLCVTCNCVHPRQRRGLFQQCPTCTAAMLPTSFNLRTIDTLTAQRDELLAALRVAVRQNSHDMLMTGEELRACEAAIAKATGSQA